MSYLSLKSQTGHFVTWECLNSDSSYKDTLVFLSGLADDTKVWEPLITHLKHSYQIILINLIGQGQALELDFDRNHHHFKISIEDQANALELIIKSLSLSQPFHLIGFSYGGAVALEYHNRHPELVKNLHLWLPFVTRLDFSNPVTQIWKSNIEFIAQLNPFTKYLSQRWSSIYHDWLTHYMHYRFSKRVPQLKLRQVAVEMSQGALDYNGLSKLQQMPPGRVHLVMSHMDTLVPVTLYHQIWSLIPSPNKGGCLHVKDGEHLLHEQSPLLLAKWLEFCITHPKLPGQDFEGWAKSGSLETCKNLELTY